jgi:hypothetical protein
MPDNGKVERFIGYLKGSFWVPFVASMRQAGLKPDKHAANAAVGRWLREVANAIGDGAVRIVGLDIHRVFAEAVMLDDGRAVRLGRIGMTREHLRCSPEAEA